MPVPPKLRWFPPHEFRHPELVDAEAAICLDDVREDYDNPIVLTSDATAPAEVVAGRSPSSLHPLGRAFDFVLPTSRELLWQLTRSVFRIQEAKGLGFEFELVQNPGAILKKDVTLELAKLVRAAKTDEQGLQILQRALRADRHGHLGVFPDQRPSRLIVALD